MHWETVAQANQWTPKLWCCLPSTPHESPDGLSYSSPLPLVSHSLLEASVSLFYFLFHPPLCTGLCTLCFQRCSVHAIKFDSITPLIILQSFSSIHQQTDALFHPSSIIAFVPLYWCGLIWSYWMCCSAEYFKWQRRERERVQNTSVLLSISASELSSKDTHCPGNGWPESCSDHT